MTPLPLAILQNLLEPAALSAELTWGTTDFKIVLRDPVRAVVKVVEDANGKPVEHFALTWRAIRHPSRLLHKVNATGRFVRGRTTVCGVWRGQSELSILPLDRQLHPAKIRVGVRDGMPVVEVRVTRLLAKKVSVLDERGAPVPNAKVEVVDPGATNSEWVNDPRSGWVVVSPDPEQPYPSLIYRATTDGNGQCILYGVPGKSDHELH